MRDHFDTVGPEIMARNETGRFAIDYLDFDDPEFIAYRQSVIDVCSAIGTEIRKMEKMKRRFVRLIHKSADDEEKESFRVELENLEQRQQRTQNLLRDVVGS
jgi:hypothetical protein